MGVSSDADHSLPVNDGGDPSREAAASPIVFGPIASRRLGCSLGIDNVVGKTCSYSCVYCQVGRTTSLTDVRRSFHTPEAIEAAVAQRLEAARRAGERIDHLSFVPTGEPTLDANLGASIRRVRRFGIPVAVVTNASLLHREAVREDLAAADWVSVKVDAVRADTWRHVDRPHGRLVLEEVLEGARAFARAYRGTLTTDTMLVAGLNDGPEDVDAVARHVATLRPSIAHITVPLRPPAEPWVRVPDAQVLAAATAIMREHVASVELLAHDDEAPPARPSDVESAILAMTAVHPLRTDALARLLAAAGADWSVVERLVRDRRLERLQHRGFDFYRSVASAPPRPERAAR